MTDTTVKHQSFSQVSVSREGSQEAPQAIAAPTPSAGGQPARPETEVLEKATRRRFSADYKRRILAEADTCTNPGDTGRLLRREGLYSSNLTNWRAQREQGILDGLSKSRGRKPREKSLLAEENARLQKENQHLREHLSQARTIIDVQKKLSQLLGMNNTPVLEGSSS